MNMPDVGGTKLKYLVPNDLSDSLPSGLDHASMTLHPAHTPWDTTLDS